MIPADTSAAALAVQTALFRRMTAAEKLHRVQQLTAAASAYALAGLRERHADADPPALLLRLAVLRLGPDVVAKAYGWRSPDHGT
jgi:hypothetical protein